MRAHLPQSKLDRSPTFLILGSCFFLLISWGLTQWIDSSSPAVRWMIYASLTGMAVLWPVIRLSQQGSVDEQFNQHEGSIHPKLILLDCFCLCLIFQSVVWPLQLNANWVFAQTLWINLTICTWTLLVGFFVAIGCRSNQGTHRTLSMVLIMAILLGEPLAMALMNLPIWPGPAAQWPMALSPLQLISSLLKHLDYGQSLPGKPQIVSVLIATFLGWFALLFNTAKLEKNSQLSTNQHLNNNDIN